MLSLNVYFSFSTAVAVRLTPQKTPKRKVAQQSLVWTLEETEEFLKICSNKKDEVNPEQVPVRVWKSIVTELKKKNIDHDWDICRAKFESLTKFFVGTLLPYGGIIAGQKCPYYDVLCKIHDMTEGVLSSDKIPGEGEFSINKLN